VCSGREEVWRKLCELLLYDALSRPFYLNSCIRCQDVTKAVSSHFIIHAGWNGDVRVIPPKINVPTCRRSVPEDSGTIDRQIVAAGL
jgi:hypothetical protein